MDGSDKKLNETKDFTVAHFLSNASHVIMRSALRIYPAVIGLKVVEPRTLHTIGLNGPIMARDITRLVLLHETQAPHRSNWTRCPVKSSSY
ncbi:MAG: hypothetical protein HQ503_02060 [Rhodospirillales bacterium]|nr:hypothetical protein [Rhodospirillales bacterium]